MSLKIEDSSVFLTSEKFFTVINEKVWKEDIPYLEATMAVCDEMEINPEDLIKLKLITPMLKCKLQEEGIAAGLLKTPTTIQLC